MKTNRKTQHVAAEVAALAAIGFAISGCTNTGASDSAGGSGAPATQKAQPASGPTCDIATYGGDKAQLKDLVVGFLQSEKEDNPFRIAETQSIKDEAAKIGVKKLITTNAQSTLSKQISDIQDMISQGAQALIVAPLNSTGLEPALAAAKAKHIPVVTVDRQLTGASACSDYLTFIGSNFVEQGQRAAKQMIAATGGNGKVAIL